jgi:hypothetical protein
MKTITTEFSISEIVYNKLDKEQNPMIVVSIWVRDNFITYECRDSDRKSEYYNEFELSKEQNILTKIS